MKNLYYTIRVFFVAVTTTVGVFSCKPRNAQSSVSYQNIEINDKVKEKTEIDEYIKPFRKHVQNEMSVTLTYNPIDLIKEDSNENTPIGNLMADASFEIINPIFLKNHGQNIDFVLLNWGGIRSNLPKGDVTMGSAYKLMPFENRLVCVKLKGNKLHEMVAYLIQSKKPHPLSKHVEIQIDKNKDVQKFTVNGKIVEPEKDYVVATSDYLFNGGDGMLFFQNPIEYYETDYSIRNALIDYFKKTDTLRTKKDNRFIHTEN